MIKDKLSCRKVTQIWSQKVSNLTQSNLEARWGLGDLIRGAANIHTACCDLGLDFELDYSGHPIAQIFAYELSEKKDNKTIFINFKNHDELIEYIRVQLASDSEIEFMSNGYGVWNDTYVNKFRDFLRPRLVLKDEYKVRAKKLLPEPFTYEVLHFRLGDNHLIEGVIDLTNDVKKVLEKNINQSTFLITDSLALKNYAVKNYGVHTLPGNPTHIGLSESLDQLFNTQLEFMLMSSARQIKTYSCYSWISGFAQSASFVYNIPLINLNKESALKESVLIYSLKYLVRIIRRFL